MRTDYQHLLIQQDGGVLTITMNRPEVLNAFNNAMLEELTEAVEAVAQDETVRCVVLTGAGRAFGSGQDLRSLAGGRASGVTGKVSEHLQKYHRVVLAIRNMPKPVIAAVHGHAAGISCNIALACDMRIAADDARFIEAFARIGLVPDGGGGYFLPHLIGVGKAMEMAMLADEVSGPEAERIGLVNKCVTCKPRCTLKVNCKIWLSRRKIIKMLLPLSCRNGHQNIKGARKGAHRHPDLQQRPDAGSKAASLAART